MGKIQVVREPELVEIVWTPATGEDQVTYRGRPEWTLLSALFVAAEDVLGPPGNDRTRAIITNRMRVCAEWIRDWDGLEVDGQPAPCDAATKMAHLLGCPPAGWYLYVEIMKRVNGIRIRGESSGSGLPLGLPSPISTAASEPIETESLMAVAL